MTNGVHPLNDGDYVNIVEYQTKKPEEFVFEKHEQYIDGFYMISGKENVHFSKTASQTVEKYRSDLDYELAKCENFKTRFLEEGEVAVLDTDIYHCPSIAVDEPQTVRKAIFKIKK